MNYNLKGTGVTISPELRSYVEKCLERADKFVKNDSTAHADVELQHSATNDLGTYRAEFTLSCGGDIFRASQWGSTMHEALDLAGGELVNELRRIKSKKLHALRHKAVAMKEFLRGWRKKI